MTEELPLACSLSASDAARRGRWWARVMERANGVSAQPGGFVARFDASAELEGELRRVAAAEAECCPFLQIDVARAPDELSLTITGPPRAQPVIAQIQTTSQPK